MLNWLKFYFLGFFSNKLSAEAERRSVLNTLLGYLLAVFILCGGLTLGYSASYGTYYKAADDFKDFYYSAFTQSGKSLGVEVKNGILSATLPDGVTSINGFHAGEDSYNKNGYRLVIDTRPAATTFDNFTLECKDKDGKVITYDEYLALDDSKKTISLIYSGEYLDVSEHMDDYTARLDKVSVESDKDNYEEETAKSYNELKDKLSKGEIKQEEYQSEIYILYIKSYYPVLDGADSYGKAPTLRTYYMSTDMSEDTGKYLILMDDMMVCSFESKNNVVEFGGYYNHKKDITVNNTLNESQKKANLDELLSGAFHSGASVNYIVYIMNFLRFSIIILGAMLIISLLIFALCKFKKFDFCDKYLSPFKIMGSYFTVSSLFVGIAAFIMSFFMSRILTYTISGYVLLGAIIIRTIIYAAPNIIRNLNENKNAPQTETEE